MEHARGKDRSVVACPGESPADLRALDKLFISRSGVMQCDIYSDATHTHRRRADTRRKRDESVPGTPRAVALSYSELITGHRCHACSGGGSKARSYDGSGVETKQTSASVSRVENQATAQQLPVATPPHPPFPSSCTSCQFPPGHSGIGICHIDGTHDRLLLSIVFKVGLQRLHINMRTIGRGYPIWSSVKEMLRDATYHFEDGPRKHRI
jgi:hypothetical protein